MELPLKNKNRHPRQCHFFLRGYDEPDRLTSNVVASGSSNLQHFNYTYDTIGNMKQRVDGVMNVTEDFAYDKLNRLLQVSGSGLTTHTFGYDALGNMTSKSDVGTYNYPAAGSYRPHAVSSITGTVLGISNPTFTHDANGNVTSAVNRTLTYTSYNMPATINGWGYSYTYTYNADHERTRLQHSTLGTFVYLHPAGKGQLLYEKETPPSGPTQHKYYINAGGMLIGVHIAKSDATTETRYFHTDHLGSLTLITNASGGTMERLAYEPFGNRRYTNGSDNPYNAIFGINTDRGFTGHEHLDEVALIHMNGRVYDPVVGRFMTADPNLGNPSDLQSYNRYSYVNNSPLMYYDPSGYFSFSLGPIHVSMANSDVRQVAAIAVAVYAPGLIGPNLGWSAMASQIAAGALSGAISSGNLQGAIAGGVSAGLFGGLHGWNPVEDAFLNGLLRTVAHGAVGGVMSEIGGGDFRSGFFSAAVTQGASQLGVFDGLGDPKTWQGRTANAVAAAVVGGTASVLGGGKFANGAVTGAFSRLFNDLTYQRMGEVSTDVSTRQGGDVSIYVGAGGSGTFMGIYASADSGFTWDTQGNYCAQSNLCWGAGAQSPLSVVAGYVGSVGQGALSSGQEHSSGLYWMGGRSVMGEGQVLKSGSGIQYSRAVIGMGWRTPDGAKPTGAGYISCATTNVCIR